MMKYDLVEVYFLKMPRGKPFFLAYNVGENGFVRRQVAEELEAAGVAEILSDTTPPKDIPAFTPIAPEPIEEPEVIEEPEDLPKWDFSTAEDVAAYFGDDVDALRTFADQEGIDISKRVKKPETMHEKIAEHYA